MKASWPSFRPVGLTARREKSVLVLFRRGLTEKDEHRTSNVQHRILQRRTSVEWEKRINQSYDLEEKLLEYSVRIIKAEELITIFATSIKSAVRQAHGPERNRRAEKKPK
jgi:hypothetical protein